MTIPILTPRLIARPTVDARQHPPRALQSCPWWSAMRFSLYLNCRAAAGRATDWVLARWTSSRFHRPAAPHTAPRRRPRASHPHRDREPRRPTPAESSPAPLPSPTRRVGQLLAEHDPIAVQKARDGGGEVESCQVAGIDPAASQGRGPRRSFEPIPAPWKPSKGALPGSPFIPLLQQQRRPRHWRPARPPLSERPSPSRPRGSRHQPG